ncbi:MerR family transcriptional regulator [Lysinibacillus sp. NPDC097287]|uniref:MerR family transcriptional regulator n=1 Tax=Lysinibacillus sp. NPDC097287 TaxID=3364144 RepID=UPI0038012750
MQIKEFAAKYNLPTDTVRYYEKEKLLMPKRQQNGYRIFDDACEKNIQFIIVLRQLGFTLQEIQQLLALEQKPISATCNQQTVQLFSSKITKIEQQIIFYQKALQSLHLAQTLMAEGKYGENKEAMALQIEAMYRSLQGRNDDYVSP